MTRSRQITFTTALLIALVAVRTQTYQQATPPRGPSASQLGSAQLGGVVVLADGSDQPIRRAIVRLSAPEVRGTREIATDDRGRFLFAELPAGRYSIWVSKPGYASAQYGQKRPQGPGTALSLADGQKETSLRVLMPRGAVVSGRVTDEFGHPIARARLGISERTTVNGQLVLSPVSSNNAETDDRGVYRIYGLTAGTYVVSVSNVQMTRDGVRPTAPAELHWAAEQAAASTTGQYSSPPPPGQTVAFTPVFHPSAFRASDAASIELEAGAERTGIDIAVRFVPVTTVSGTVTMPDGAPAAAVTTILIGDPPISGPGGLKNSTANARGEFTFTSVQSGQYKVMVQASSRGAGGRGGGPLDLWGMSSVSVAGNAVGGVTVALQPGMTVNGRIVIDPMATTKLPDLTTTRISLGAAQGTGASFGVAAAAISADGTFTMTGAAPGSYRMMISPPLAPNTMGAPYVWVTKSVTVGGREVLERPFDIGPGENIDGIVVTLTDRITSLTGKLLEPRTGPRPITS